ncbi:uncharacterized protein LOC110458062 [Mizuhopecten yessoensis]|uniref:uncharacterized protein LOC110458062 n=1 Tax=Mizuhopecten yessoensis TaxID=6573 RepID=UPI000B45C9EE|nr:uncharacterized protein LOC110458062 [Mizuhopecten yessoensis]
MTRLFADDTALAYSSKNLHDIKQIINYDMEQLNLWSNKWLMNFNHKHLGVIISNNGTWNSHIEHILTNTTKYIATLRKLKYILNRKNLEKIYLVFIRPLFEYACEVWDNCNITFSNKLENMQYEAGRIITGLPIYTKKEFIYRELGWKSLIDRRRIRKLSMFYNIYHDNAPSFLKSLLPPIVSNFSNYNLRNRNNFQNPYYRLQITKSSFIPSTSDYWNNLSIETKSSASIKQFKSLIQPQVTTPSYIKCFLEYGSRKVNIIHCQLRNRSSSLNYDLFKAHLRDNSTCDCGNDSEDSSHFLLNCKKFDQSRNIMLQSLDWYNEITVEHLLFGDANLDYNLNIQICRSVQLFILSSKRFNM